LRSLNNTPAAFESLMAAGRRRRSQPKSGRALSPMFENFWGNAHVTRALERMVAQGVAGPSQLIEQALSAAHGIDAIMTSQRLDALLFPGASGALLSARPGYPTVLVPFAMVPNSLSPPLPAGFDAKPSPFGVSFAGSACSEPRLVELGYAFEQATKKRVPPAAIP